MKKNPTWTSKHRCAGHLLSILLLLLALTGCGTNSIESENSNTATQTPVDEYTRELKALRNADFDYIFSFKRKDGKPMDSADKRFVKDNSHFATNRFTLAKDETVIFAGSNYKFDKDGLAALKDRFDVADHSKPEEELEKQRLEQESNTGKGNESDSGAAEKKDLN